MKSNIGLGRLVFVVFLASALSLIALVPSSWAVSIAFVRGHGAISGCISSPSSCQLPLAQFTVNASQDPLGVSAQGSYTFKKNIGSVQCLALDAVNLVVSVGGTIESSTNPAVIGQHYVVYFQTSHITRNGGLAAVQTVSRPDIDPEATLGEQLPPDFPTTCPTTVGGIPFYPVLRGSVQAKYVLP
jgi:hypothetical protein